MSATANSGAPVLLMALASVMAGLLVLEASADW
jgi:hypothetical protein